MKKNNISSEIFVDAILSNKDLKTIEKLSESADLNYIYLSEYTPFIAATMVENIEVLNFLVKNNADVNQVNSYNQTALHHAFRYNKIKSATYLLNLKETKIDLKDIYGTRPIDWAKYNRNQELINLYNEAKNKEDGLIK